MLANGQAFTVVTQELSKFAQSGDLIAGIEARGFIFAAAIAADLGEGFIPIRKSGKLPFQTHAKNYALEYGEATIEIHTDAIAQGQRVLLIDDVLATGGTMCAAIELVAACGGVVSAIATVLEITSLGGRDKILSQFPDISIHALMSI